MTKMFSDATLHLIRVASTFGMTLGISIYLFSVLLGGWLDQRLGSAPICRLILLFFALAASFTYLYKQIVAMDKIDKKPKKEGGEE